MKIHEYQAKDILEESNIPIQGGCILTDLNQSKETLKKVSEKYNCSEYVVKAQIHAGGRGKGGGVKFSPDAESALKNIEDILGMNLVTHQTGAEGQKVNTIMVTEAIDIDKEYYIAITLDRSKEANVIMASTEGGVDIEEVAAKTPEKIIKVWVKSNFGIQGYQAREVAQGLGLEGNALKQGIKLIMALYNCYVKTDASIAEINPLVLTKQGNLIALDAKFNFDANALYRQKKIAEMRDLNEEDPTEVEASKFNLNYIKLDGNVGCMVNGAGLAMATMDIIKLKGGEPANFLDVGGGANVETVKNGFRIILSDDKVKAVLINIFGGIVRCDRVANGIVKAVEELGLKVPVVVRLAGTNAEIAKEILKESGLKIIPASTLEEAAEAVVEATKVKKAV
ncbi:MAG: ADP-forming succinate--CoA ligase subunit beta [bacterium]